MKDGTNEVGRKFKEQRNNLIVFLLEEGYELTEISTKTELTPERIRQIGRDRIGYSRAKVRQEKREEVVESISDVKDRIGVDIKIPKRIRYDLSKQGTSVREIQKENRKREVLRLVKEGKKPVEIKNLLGLSLATVYKYTSSKLMKQKTRYDRVQRNSKIKKDFSIGMSKTYLATKYKLTQQMITYIVSDTKPNYDRELRRERAREYARKDSSIEVVEIRDRERRQ